MPEPMSEAINEALYALLTDKKILRDFIAGCALAGMLASGNYGPNSQKECTVESYSMADAMLAAREENESRG